MMRELVVALGFMALAAGFGSGLWQRPVVLVLMLPLMAIVSTGVLDGEEPKEEAGDDSDEREG